jgi:hypothetical protein
LGEFFNRYFNFSFNASLILIPLLIIIFFSYSQYHKIVCDPLEKKIEQQLEFIRKNEDSIIKIILKKSAPDWKVNLIDKEFIIEDPATLQEIRNMINTKQLGQWNRPTRKWEVLMILELSNNEKLTIEVNKIENDQKGMTHLYFFVNKCHDDLPNYSLELGELLEWLTNYNDIPY